MSSSYPQPPKDWKDELLQTFVKLSLEELPEDLPPNTKVHHLLQHEVSNLTSQAEKLTQLKLEGAKRRVTEHAFWADALPPNPTRYFTTSSTRYVFHNSMLCTVQDLPVFEVLKKAEDSKQAFEKAFETLATLPKGHQLGLPLLFLEHRESVLQDFASLACSLQNNTKRGNGGAGRLLMGPKGTGKTTFLHCFTLTVPLLCPNVVVVFIDYGRTLYGSTPVLPSQLLYHAYLISCGKKLEYDENLQTTNYQHVLPLLLGSNKRYLVVADEFDKVYQHAEPDLARMIVTQFQALGGGTEGVVSAIISGSSAALYDLCFCQRTAHIDKKKYLGFSGISLNSGRYTDCRFKAIRGAASFRDVLEHIVEASENEDHVLQFFRGPEVEKLKNILEKEDMHAIEHLYAVSGGKFRYLQQALDDMNGLITIHVRNFGDMQANETYKNILQMLCKKADENAALTKDSYCAFNDPILDHTHFKDSDLSFSDIYNLGDANHFYVEVTQAGPRVTFESRIVEQLWRGHERKTDVSPYQAVCLTYPYGQLGIDAEALVLHSLVKNTKVAKLPTGIVYSRRMFSMIPCTPANRDLLMDHLKKDDVVVVGNPDSVIGLKRVQTRTKTTMAKMQTTLVLKEIMKEYPDHTGADAILFCQDKVLEVHRFQIKLGSSELSKTQAKKIIAKINKGRGTLADLLKNIPVEGKHIIIDYLVTTRPLSSTATELFKEQNMNVLGKEEMYNIWTEDIIAFDKSIRLGVYAPP